MLVHVSDVGWALLALLRSVQMVTYLLFGSLKGSFCAFTNIENLNADFLKMFLMIVAGAVFTESKNNSTSFFVIKRVKITELALGSHG